MCIRDRYSFNGNWTKQKARTTDRKVDHAAALEAIYQIRMTEQKEHRAKTIPLREKLEKKEITNAEYRQFVNWVRDSVVRTELAVAAYNKIGEEINEDDPLWDFMPIYNRVDDGEEKTAYQEYLEENFKGELDIDDKSTYRLNWDTKLIWERTDYPDANYAAVLEGGIGPDLLNDYDGYFFPADSTPNGLKAFKTKKIKYNSREFNSEKNKWNEYKAIEIYPDTTVWYRDFSFSYNEPMHNDYFWHDAYAEYPVVGVSWEQAKAFAHWRTFYKNQHQRKAKKNIQLVSDFRLPTEAEWEYAARGGFCLLYTSPSPRDRTRSRMPSSA